MKAFIKGNGICSKVSFCGGYGALVDDERREFGAADLEMRPSKARYFLLVIRLGM
jgi:hypothetical protein